MRISFLLFEIFFSSEDKFESWFFFFLIGKTRTRDKYRIVYTDQQRYELENEFIISKYISIPRKSALSLTLSLSERQVSENKEFNYSIYLNLI